MILHNKQETTSFARRLASSLKPGDIVLFTGSLGVGKTFLCGEIIRYFCGANTQVSSPTFNLLHTYKADTFLIYHYDFYRLQSISELEELGIEEALQQNAILLIEWPKIAYPFLPSTNIKIHLELLEGEKRHCLINDPRHTLFP